MKLQMFDNYQCLKLLNFIKKTKYMVNKRKLILKKKDFERIKHK